LEQPELIKILYLKKLRADWS